MIITLTGATASKHLGGLNFYSIIVNKSSGVTVTLDKTTVDKDTASSTTVTGTLTVAEGYTLSSVTITMGGTDITSSCYDPSTGAITISGITGNVVVKATATSNSGSGDSGSGDNGGSEPQIVNLYSAEDYPVQMAYYGNSMVIDSSDTTVIKYPSLSRSTPSIGFDIFQFPVEAGKTYSIKLYDAPTSITVNGDTNNDGTADIDPTTRPYFGIFGLLFFETINGLCSCRYAHTTSNGNAAHIAYWNTSKTANYTGHIPISETNDTTPFAITKSYNAGAISITNLTTGATNADNDKCVFGSDANKFTQACRVAINDESITHMTIMIGDPTHGLYQMASKYGDISADEKVSVKETIQNGLVIVEGKNLPTNYVPYEG